MSLFNLDELKKSSIYITPNFPSLQTKRYKFTFFKVLGYVLIFALIIAILTSLLLVLTPARQFLFFIENEKLVEKAEEIKELEKKVAILTHELNSISSTTSKLKYAMMLGQVDSVDSNTKNIYDSLKKVETRKSVISPEGFVYKAFIEFIKKYFEKDSLNTEMLFLEPTSGIIINNFNESKGHLGLDFAVKMNTPIYASEEGLVVFSGYDIDDGYSVIIQHSQGFLTKYKHCGQLLAKERDYVERGELIARSGNSGFNTSGPHLHFEMWQNGYALDPNKYLLLEGEPNGK